MAVGTADRNAVQADGLTSAGALLDLLNKQPTFDGFWPMLTAAAEAAGLPRIMAAYAAPAQSGPYWRRAGAKQSDEYLRIFAAPGVMTTPTVPGTTRSAPSYAGLNVCPVKVKIEIGDDIDEGELLILHEPSDGAALLAPLISRLYAESIGRQSARIRHLISQLSMTSKDMNSVANKVIEHILQPILGIGAACVFVEHNRAPYMGLSACRGIPKQKQNHEIQVFLSDRQIFAEVFRCREPCYTPHVSGFLDDFFSTHGFRTRKFEPLAHAVVPLTAKSNSKDTKPFCAGVMWAAIVETSALDTPGFTWELEHFLHLVAQEVGFRAATYRNANLIDIDFDRVCHGLNVNVLAAKQKLELLNKEIFVNENYALTSRTDFSMSQTEREIEQLKHGLQTSIILLDDLHFQLMMSQREEGGVGEPHVVPNLFADVLQKAVNLAPAIALVHSRPIPRISNLKKAGAESIPPVMGNEAALLTVFRNLFENAIKYTPGHQTPDIDLWFEDANQHFIVHVRDHGIGVPEDEAERLFMDGFRGSKARRLTFRGSGIGLTHCLRIMRGLKGDILYEAADPGSRFAVKFLKAPTQPHT